MSESKNFSKILGHSNSVLPVRMKVSERSNIAEIIDGVAVKRRQPARICSARIPSNKSSRKSDRRHEHLNRRAVVHLQDYCVEARLVACLKINGQLRSR